MVAGLSSFDPHTRINQSILQKHIQQTLHFISYSPSPLKPNMGNLRGAIGFSFH
jgi:hypothetical protein